ncbi:hypothetical protein PSAC2689_70213 [Paraburkholderia sacchari]
MNVDIQTAITTFKVGDALRSAQRLEVCQAGEDWLRLQPAGAVGPMAVGSLSISGRNGLPPISCVR